MPPDDRRKIEAEFHKQMLDRYNIDIKQATGVRFGRIIGMICNIGGVEAARKLNSDYRGKASEGYEKLWDERCLHLSFEDLMLIPRFRPLFAKHELLWAYQRLEQYPYPDDKPHPVDKHKEFAKSLQ